MQPASLKKNWDIKSNIYNAICLCVCLLPMAGRTAEPIKTKLGIGTHVDPGSVLGKVKVKVIWRHMANANKTPYRGPQGPREFEDKEALRAFTEARRAETTPSGGRVIAGSYMDFNNSSANM